MTNINGVYNCNLSQIELDNAICEAYSFHNCDNAYCNYTDGEFFQIVEEMEMDALETRLNGF